MILPSDDDLPLAGPTSAEQTPQPAQNRPATLAIDEDKSDAIAALPKPASLSPQQQAGLPNPPKIAIAPEFVYVTGSRVNLRNGPSTATRIVGSFDRRTKLILQETIGDWTKVSGNQGGVAKTGWMATRFLSSEPPKRSAPETKPAKRQVAQPTTREVARARQEIISQSIANYSGNCPCPYNRDRANRRCGKRSAWSRPGGRSPICYESDVTRSRLTAYFARQGKNWP